MCAISQSARFAHLPFQSDFGALVLLSHRYQLH
jgi:hypothetical protein